MTRDRDRETGAAEAEDAFLARWSRRKRASRDTGVPEDVPRDPPEEGPAAASGAAAEGGGPGDDAGIDADAPDERDLPAPEALGPDSDFSAYLSRRVSGGLRRAAMRRLFSLPDFNVRDGLDDYDEDYTQFASLGDTVTADMKHHAERRRQRQAEEDERERELAARESASPDAGEHAGTGEEDPDAAVRQGGADAAGDTGDGDGEPDGVA